MLFFLFGPSSCSVLLFPPVSGSSSAPLVQSFRGEATTAIDPQKRSPLVLFVKNNTHLHQKTHTNNGCNKPHFRQVFGCLEAKKNQHQQLKLVYRSSKPSAFGMNPSPYGRWVESRFLIALGSIKSSMFIQWVDREILGNTSQTYPVSTQKLWEDLSGAFLRCLGSWQPFSGRARHGKTMHGCSIRQDVQTLCML